MNNQFQRVIHLLSTDRLFRQSALSDMDAALSDFELSEEERGILFEMRQMFQQPDARVDGPDGPWGWQFASPELHLSDGPDGPWGWQFASPKRHLQSS